MKTISLIIASLLVLSACSEEEGDLQVWMKSTQASAKSKVKPIAPPEKVERVTYYAPQTSGPNAFNEDRMRAAYQSTNMPDLNRSKELLENYSLESLKYVGSIGSGDNLSAMIEVDGFVYTVKPGNYIGQNLGRITSIKPEVITIQENVEDVYGKWNPRNVDLPLSDSDSPSK
ncbi:pilus assembly protein PilP [Kingella negevensis]|uniref:Pilus assembly protein, PilP n=1 Tax=Kingella negevensis TaxID=1522312 RepID=A0A238HE09_9NEIS|nr:pilus assembly protein PilP [Kingella negevensis]MDK4679946.1 pilus assembly protein PilP [Kingella negevensis]MDK4682335.1 pilus assembly protein PilP [Kingella negevensis]MDK4684587.1 pilus assembly protein PilP [Kingella negevensis]MDK4688351.1 pilus assembly protein PilP [Kingella negevensis]MDK4690532.1 pilus assembly protein PilP [Kingella negevensis]